MKEKKKNKNKGGKNSKKKSDAKNNAKGIKQSSSTNSLNDANGSEEDDKQAIENKWRKRLERNKNKQKDAENTEKALEYARTNIDFFRAFDDRDVPEMPIYDSFQRE